MDQARSTSANYSHLGFDLPAAPSGYKLLPKFIFCDLLDILTCINQLEEGSSEFLLNQLRPLFENTFVSVPSLSKQESILRRLRRYLILALELETEAALMPPLTSMRYYIECIDRLVQDLSTAYLTNSPIKASKEIIHRLRNNANGCLKHYLEWSTARPKNENFYLFVLQRKEKISQVCGESFLAELLNTSHTEIAEFLTTRYTERGFTHILPSIDRLLTATQA